MAFSFVDDATGIRINHEPTPFDPDRLTLYPPSTSNDLSEQEATDAIRRLLRLAHIAIKLEKEEVDGK